MTFFFFFFDRHFCPLGPVQPFLNECTCVKWNKALTKTASNISKVCLCVCKPLKKWLTALLTLWIQLGRTHTLNTWSFLVSPGSSAAYKHLSALFCLSMSLQALTEHTPPQTWQTYMTVRTLPAWINSESELSCIMTLLFSVELLYSWNQSFQNWGILQHFFYVKLLRNNL